MNWFKKLFGATTPPACTEPAKPAQQCQSESNIPKAAPIHEGDFEKVNAALTRIMEASEDAVRLEHVKALQAMGGKSLAPLLRAAFGEVGDPTTQNIDVFRIRMAVWCGCALHPKEFQNCYRTRYSKGISPRLDEMRSINMKDGMNGQTMIHKLLRAGKGVRAAAATPASRSPVPSDSPKPSAQDVGALLKSGMEYYQQQNYVEARKNFAAAAKLGNPEAQSMLGVIYDNGHGVATNYQEAMKWFRQGAQKGHAPAEFCLGVMYRDGHGVSQDYNEATKWIRKSAERGYDEAQFNLGLMYLYGHGVTQDFQEAAKWWRRSAAQGNVNAHKNLSLLASKGMC